MRMNELCSCLYSSLCPYCLQLVVTTSATTLYFQPHLKGSNWSLGEIQTSLAALKLSSLLRFPWNLEWCPFSWHDPPPRTGSYRLSTQVFQVPKEKKHRVRSRAMHWPHYGFSLSVYRVLKLALLRNHANASLYLHNCSGILDRNEARDLLIEWSGSREKLLLTFWCWLRVCIWTCWKTDTWGSRMMHLFQALGMWVIPAEKLNQNMINQSRKRPTGRDGELKGRNVGILLMQKEREKKTSIYEILCEV